MPEPRVRARHSRLVALSAADAEDRARRLGGPDASRVKVRPRRDGAYTVQFVVPQRPAKAQPGRALTKRRCAACDHLLEDHYRGYCSEWGCMPCR